MHHMNNAVIMQTEQLSWIETLKEKLYALGARGQLPSGSMLSTWWVLKQFAHLLPSG